MRFEITIPMLVQYLAWRNTQHTPKVIMEIFALLQMLHGPHVTTSIIEAPMFVPFAQRLRVYHGYSWLTAREAVIVYNLVILQNRYPVGHPLITQLDDDYAKNNNCSSHIPEVFKYARSREEVATKNPLLAKAAKAEKTAQRRRDKRVRVQGEPVPELLFGDGPNYPY